MTDNTQFFPGDTGIEVPPERLAWDKDGGYFTSDLGEVINLPLPFLLAGSVYVYAAWSDTIGNPICFHVGQECQEREHEQGIRLGFFLMNTLTQEPEPYYCDFFGLGRNAAIRVVKLANNHGPQMTFTRVHSIQTKRRGKPFVIPVADIPDSASISEKGAQDEPDQATHSED